MSGQVKAFTSRPPARHNITITTGFSGGEPRSVGLLESNLTYWRETPQRLATKRGQESEARLTRAIARTRVQPATAATIFAAIAAQIGKDADAIEVVIPVRAEPDFDGGIDVHSCIVTADVYADDVLHFRDGQRFPELTQDQLETLEAALYARQAATLD